MLFVLGVQVNEHVFFNPKSQGGFFNSNSVKRPVNVYRPHDLFTNFDRHFFNLRRSKYSPFKF